MNRAGIPQKLVNTPRLNRNVPRFHEERGYLFISIPEHQLANACGYVPVHRLMACVTVRRAVQPWEVVHHINGDKLDNRPINLMVLPGHDAHLQIHRAGWTETQTKIAAIKARDKIQKDRRIKNG